MEKIFPDLEIDNGIIPIKKLILKTKIYVSTYNATTFLESLLFRYTYNYFLG